MESKGYEIGVQHRLDKLEFFLLSQVPDGRHFSPEKLPGKFS